MIFLNPDKYCDTPIVSLLGDTIKTGLRKLFTVVDHDKLLAEVRLFYRVSINFWSFDLKRFKQFKDPTF